jgi:long-chain acyl-CoA synthetase
MKSALSLPITGQAKLKNLLIAQKGVEREKMYIYDMFIKTKSRHQNKVALVCDKEAYSYSDLNHLITELGDQMILGGVSFGSKVGITIDEPIQFIIALLAVSYANAVAIPIYSKTGLDKIKQVVNNFEVNYLISDVSTIIIENKNCKVSNINNLTFYEFLYAIDKDILSDVELILFSSGTTNMPKAIMLTSKNIQTNLDGISEYLKLTEHDKILLIKNLVHASSLIGELFISFFNGCTVYLTRKMPTPAVIVDLFIKNEITIFFAVPTILQNLISYHSRKFFEVQSLRIINFYGAKMPQDSIIKLINTFADVNIIYSYGLTEAAPRVTYIEGKDLRLKPSSSGKPIKDVSVMINTLSGSVEVGFIGEIIVKGSNIMKGYYKNRDLTSRVLIDDMLFTGDLGYLDKDGCLYVTGRKDNMFITSGKNIYPEEIEEVLLQYNGIQEALVKGEYNESSLLDVNAYIVVNNPKIFDKTMLYKYLKSNLENYKIPKNVFITEMLKKTVTGKIIRR